MVTKVARALNPKQCHVNYPLKVIIIYNTLMVKGHSPHRVICCNQPSDSESVSYLAFIPNTHHRYQQCRNLVKFHARHNLHLIISHDITTSSPARYRSPYNPSLTPIISRKRTRELPRPRRSIQAKSIRTSGIDKQEIKNQNDCHPLIRSFRSRMWSFQCPMLI